MITIVFEDKTQQITGTNISLKGDTSELWGERPSGKTLKLVVADEDTIKLYKEAIDHAVKEGHTTFEIK